MSGQAPALEKQSEKQEDQSIIRPLLKADVSLWVWLVFLSMGGAILALYYAHIGYMPNIEWQCLLIYLAVAAIIGAALGGLHFLSLFLPGFLWAEFLIKDSSLEGLLCYAKKEVDDGKKDDNEAGIKKVDDNKKARREPSIREIGRHLGRPFTLVYGTSHFLLPLGWGWYVGGTVLLLLVSSRMVYRKCDDKLKGKLLDSPPDSSVASVPPCSRKYSDKDNKPSNQRTDDGRRLFKYVFGFALSVVLSQIAMFLIYCLTKPNIKGFITLSFICTIVVVTSNHIVAARYAEHPAQAVVASSVAAFLLLFAANSFADLSATIMAQYGFGERKVTLFLNEDGQKAVKRLGFCPSPECDGPIDDVKILSSVGSEYLFSLKGTDFTLPKTMVLSWTTKNKSGD